MDEKKVKDLTAYNDRFDEDPTSFNDFQASDYVKELKNQGKEDKAIEVGRTFLEQCPELSGYINYYGYALYNRYINIDDEKIAENEKLFYDILEEIASHCRQERYSPLEAAINKAIKYESKKNPVDYKKLSDLLDYLDAPTLEDAPFVNKEGKEFESKKEKWYRMKVRALYEIGNYSECLKQAQIAIGLLLKWHYNNLNWVQYYKACALVKLGRYEEAENVFIALKDKFRAVDFSEILYDLYLHTGRENVAYTQLFYDFFLNGFDYRYVSNYKKIAELAKEKGEERAYTYASAMIKKLEEEHGNTYDVDVDVSEYDANSASYLFDQFYNEIMRHLDKYIERHEGRIVYYNENKQFGSIGLPTEEDNLFFRQADYIYDEEVVRGDTVEYSVIKTFDKKKQAPSSKAILIRTIF